MRPWAYLPLDNRWVNDHAIKILLSRTRRAGSLAAPNRRGGLLELSAEGTRKVTVAGESGVESNVHEWPVGFDHILKRPADTQFVAILMQGQPGCATKHSA